MDDFAALGGYDTEPDLDGVSAVRRIDVQQYAVPSISVPPVRSGTQVANQPTPTIRREVRAATSYIPGSPGVVADRPAPSPATPASTSVPAPTPDIVFVPDVVPGSPPAASREAAYAPAVGGPYPADAPAPIATTPPGAQASGTSPPATGAPGGALLLGLGVLAAGWWIFFSAGSKEEEKKQQPTAALTMDGIEPLLDDAS